MLDKSLPWKMTMIAGKVMNHGETLLKILIQNLRVMLMMMLFSCIHQEQLATRKELD